MTLCRINRMTPADAWQTAWRWCDWLTATYNVQLNAVLSTPSSAHPNEVIESESVLSLKSSPS